MSFVVALTKQGQLGNRLLQFGHLIGFSRRTGVPILNPAFGEFAELFEGTATGLFVQYPPSVSYRGSSVLQRLLETFCAWVPGEIPSSALQTLTAERPLDELVWQPKPPRLLRLLLHRYLLMRAAALDPRQDPHAASEHLISLLGPEDVQLGDPTFLAFLRSREILYLDGWNFRDVPGFRAAAAAVKAFLTPLAAHRVAIERCHSHARKRGDVLVGVHIRRGDYATHQSGQFFFEWSDYARVMTEIARALLPRRVVFLVCSNEQLDPVIEGRGDVVRGPGQAVEDMYALARCDLIVGPPSTFSGWASFFGDVPLLQVRTRDQPIVLDGVRPIYPF